MCTILISMKILCISDQSPRNRIWKIIRLSFICLLFVSVKDYTVKEMKYFLPYIVKKTCRLFNLSTRHAVTMTTDLQNFLPTKEDEQNFLSIISEREEVSLVMRKRDELKTNSWPWSTPHCWCLAQEWSAFLIGADDECEQICCKLSPMVNLLSRSLLDGNTIHTESKYVLSDLSRPDILYNKL